VGASAEHDQRVGLSWRRTYANSWRILLGVTRSAVVYLSSAEAAAGRDQAPDLGGDAFAVVATVREEQSPRGGSLARALEIIASGEASVLVAPELGTCVGSLRELIALLDWLDAARADLVALDVGLDTAGRAGDRVVRVLREVERLERALRGRPGIAARAPELSERIAAMRKRGLSLRAIADALNAEDVPTQRGGTHWRPSSVQSALGYRRPRPPLAGAPPPPPHHGHRPPSPRPRPPGRDGPTRRKPPRP
jgi:hypothetical protein